MNKLRKYIYIYESELMSTLQYVGNILFNTIGYIVLIFIFFYLWNYIYDDPTQLIHSYSKNQMIWYVILTEILWGTTGPRQLCRKICDDVRSGNIAYAINKPYHYICYAISSHLGEITIKALIVTSLGMGLGFLFMREFPTISFFGILMVIVSCFLAVLINSLIITFIGMLSFFIEDANPIQWLYSKILLILGTIFPIEFFPSVLQPIIKFSPIYVVCYGPAKLFVDFKVNMFLQILLFQIVYIIIAFILCHLIYKKGVKRLNVNGG